MNDSSTHRKRETRKAAWLTIGLVLVALAVGLVFEHMGWMGLPTDR